MAKLGKAEADNERTNHSRQTKRPLERIELEQTKKENVITNYCTLRQSSLKINFPSMGLPPTKIEAVISNVSSTNSNTIDSEEEKKMNFLQVLSF